MESILPADFTFSQSNLQTYSDCPRRFWLLYVQRLPWPAVEASPVQEAEYVMRLGQAFHLAVQRAESGIPAELIASQLEDPLDTWFDGYVRHRPHDLPTEVVEVESLLATNLQIGNEGPSYRLAAKYDLLTIDPGKRAVIMDWKTSRRRPQPVHYRQRLQSQIYPYILVTASENMPWGPIKPEQVQMRYWFTVAPDEPITLRYDTAQHAAIGQLLLRLLTQILAGQGEDDLPKVPDTEANRARLCAYCAYRSRCNRGILAGDLNDITDVDDMILDPGADLEINLSDVQELAF